jgi:transposase
VITASGVKPIVPVTWGRDNFWIYGVIEPLSGWSLMEEYPHLDTQNFQTFIDSLSRHLGTDIAVMQLDQAGAHITSALHWPDNFIPILQPAHSPELNPIERVWQFVKAQLKGESFSSIEALRLRVQSILANLLPSRIISLSSFDFILEALFYAASF